MLSPPVLGLDFSGKAAEGFFEEEPQTLSRFISASSQASRHRGIEQRLEFPPRPTPAGA